MVANRFVQLDHVSRGRNYWAAARARCRRMHDGHRPFTQRDRMERSFAAIMALLKCEGRSP